MSATRRIARNSLVPMFAQLVNRLVDAGFAIYVLRVLGADGAGQYAFAVVTWLYVKTISDFGLNVLATRDVARQPELASRWLGGGVVARLLVLAALLPALGLLLAAYGWSGRLPAEAGLAVALLAISIVPAALSDSATAVFTGEERMVVPALVTVGSTLLKVLVAGGLLAAGAGVVGLAGAAVVVNIASGALLWRLASRGRPPVVWWPGLTTLRAWLVAAWPLLINGLLVNLFFRVDTYVIQATRGQAELGLYDAAYKFINLTLIVPPYLTMALFPSLARQAEREPAALRRTLRLAITYMLYLALPAAVVTTLLAEPLIWLLAGPGFLPGASDALRLLIWFLPFSYVNGLIQYGLVALNRQRTITGAFAATVLFNVVANVLWVPAAGLTAAAIVTVLSEVVLLVPLLVVLRAELGPLRLWTLLWRPGLGFLAMGSVAIVSLPLGVWAAAALAVATFAVALLLAGAWGDDERRIVRALLGRT